MVDNKKYVELLWAEKYEKFDKGEKIPIEKPNLPFQVVETINKPRIKGGITTTLFPEDEWPENYPKDWKNLLVWGDNKLIMSSLIKQGWAGKINLIYIDPPFFTGTDFTIRTKIGDEQIEKAPSIIEERAYSDTWSGGIASYLKYMYERLVLLRELLTDQGHIWIHLDEHVSHYVKVMMDEIFGYDNFINEIIWWKGREGGASRKHSDTSIMPTEYQTILLYAKNRPVRKWNPPLGPYKLSTVERIEKDEKGWFYRRGRMGRKPAEWELEAGVSLKSYVSNDPNEPKEEVLKRLTSPGSQFVTLGNVWDKNMVKNTQAYGYGTEKPEALLNRIILASSNPGDIVADFFCGSVTTLATAEKLGRRWLGCDLSKFAIQVTRKRLLDIHNSKDLQEEEK